MLPEVRNYLDEVRSHLHLDPLTEKRVIGELYTHFQERIAELQDRGISERDAGKVAIESFGRARVVARLTYEAYSKGSWSEAAKAALPHFLIAGLFLAHLWRQPVLAPLVFITIVGVTLFGWWHGKPNWLYSWIGYAFLPLLIMGFTSRPVVEQAASFLFWGSNTPPSWTPVSLLLSLFSLSLAIIISTTVRVVKRDWILASLMLVPLPIVGSWLANIEQAGGLFQGNGATLYQWDGVMALVLVVLGLASAIFIRLRQRILKAGALVTIGTIAGAIAVHTFWGNLGFFSALGAAFLLLLFLLSPALLEAKIGHGEARGEVWWWGDWVEHPSATK